MSTCSYCNAVLTDSHCLACALVEMPTPAILEATLPDLKVLELTGGEATTAIFQVEDRLFRRRASLIVIGGIVNQKAFQDRVRPWACLDHPYIQSIYRMTFVSGWACLLTAPLTGNLLDDAIEEESWTESRAKATLLAICQVVRHIHQQNFAHGHLDRESIYARPDHHITVTLIGIHNDHDASISTLQAKDFRALCEIGRAVAGTVPLKGRLSEILTAPETPADTVSAILEIESSLQSDQAPARKRLRHLFGS